MATEDKKITDPEVIEQIRDAMPEATDSTNGLCSPKRYKLTGECVQCNIGNYSAGKGDTFLVIKTNVRKVDTQFCFEIIDCNNYSNVKPTHLLVKGYNPNNTVDISNFQYLSDNVFSNILGGYVNGTLTFLIPHFGRYDAAIVRSLDQNNVFNYSLSFTEAEPNWESRFIAS